MRLLGSLRVTLDDESVTAFEVDKVRAPMATRTQTASPAPSRQSTERHPFGSSVQRVTFA